MAPAARGGRLRRRLFEAALFLFLAVAGTWPLATHLADSLPLGTEEAATVPLLNLWTLWWNADRAAAGFADYWQAPIFCPARNALAFSEPLSPTLLAAPLLWLGLPTPLVYNLLLLAVLTANGLAFCAVVRRQRLHPLVAPLGGAMAVLSPLLLSWLGVLQLVAVFPALLTVAALSRVRGKPTLGRGLLFGFCLGLTALCCSYYGLFLLLPLAVATPFLFGRRLWQGRTLAALGVGLAFCLVLVGPQLLVQKEALAGQLRYDPRTLAALSAVAADYLVPPRPSLFGVSSLAPSGHVATFKLGLGLVTAALALIGGLFGATVPRYRAWACFWLAFAGTAFLLSLGPLLAVGGVRPYLLLVDTLPGFAQARNIMRFAVYVHLAVPVLACLGLHGTAVFLRRCLFWQAGSVVVALLCLGLLAAGEILPAPQRLFALPGGGREPAWVSWIKGQPERHAPIACLPFASAPDVVSYEREALRMYWQTMHRRPMLNGYSGYFPEDFTLLKWRLAVFPDPPSLDLLEERGVRLCVVDSSRSDSRDILARSRGRLRLLYADEQTGVRVFLLQPGAGAPPSR